MSNTHFVINGSNVTSAHPDEASAEASAMSQAKAGRTVSLAQLVKTYGPNTGVVVVDAAGNETIVKG